MSDAGRETIIRFQRQLLAEIRGLYSDTPLSEATENAFLATPRHLFVRRYRNLGTKDWHDVGEHNLYEHLATLYMDRPLCLVGDDDNNVASTISQPSLVLHMLDMLQLRSGQAVFELGAGAGWNAALIGQLVGPEGHVYSAEIITEVATMAAENIKIAGVTNVRILAGEGGNGFVEGAPYDRAVFTAGAYDLPRHFYNQIRDEGLLLMVVKSDGGGDNLFLLRKKADHFESLASMPCAFVQLRGQYQVDSLEPMPVESLPAWSELKHLECCRTPFWWGWKGNDYSVVWRTLGIRCFLSIAEPTFRAFRDDDYYFGLWDQDHHSLVLARNDALIAYGNSHALEQLRRKIHEWVDLGMPGGASFALQIYPIDAAIVAGPNQWIVKRDQSQFLWSL